MKTKKEFNELDKNFKEFTIVPMYQDLKDRVLELEQQLKTKDEKIEKLTKCVENMTQNLHVSVDQIELARQTLKEIKEQGE